MDCSNPGKVFVNGHWLEVPCGTCILCRIARTREWSTRLKYENMMWKESVFVTLTYDEDHIPLTGCGYSTLVKRDLQLFFKRLRSRLFNCSVDDVLSRKPFLTRTEAYKEARQLSRIKYFACGEYGQQTHGGRAHYHAIIFGLGPSDIATFNRLWPYGFVSVGGVSPESIQYVTGYVRKKLYKKFEDPKDFQCPHRIPEFQICSQGLGLDAYNRYRDTITGHMYMNVDGHRESIPRYFLKKDDETRLRLQAYNELFNPRMENLKRAQEILNARDNTKSILDEMRKSSVVRERNENAKNALFQKGSI